MSPTRRVVVTGASRGLGLATAAHLHRQGWHVLAAVRDPGTARARLQLATGARDGDARLDVVRLDLADDESIEHAATAIGSRVDAPDGIVHNAGITTVGSVEDVPAATWDELFRTNLFGPVRLTQALLPAMRRAGRGRVVAVSSQGAIRGMPSISAYGASKAALERWAQSLAAEVAPFGIGVSVLVAGTFRTDILEPTETFRDPDGPYAELYDNLERVGGRMLRFAAAPERFAPAVERALNERASFTRRGVGPDARLMLGASRVLPERTLARLIAMALGLPKAHSERGEP